MSRTVGRLRSWRYSSDLGAESFSDSDVRLAVGGFWRSGLVFFEEVYLGVGTGLTQDISSGWPDFGMVGVSGRTNSDTPRALLGNLANTVTSRTFRVPTGNGTLPFLAMKAESGIETVLPAGMPAGSEA